MVCVLVIMVASFHYVFNALALSNAIFRIEIEQMMKRMEKISGNRNENMNFLQNDNGWGEIYDDLSTMHNEEDCDTHQPTRPS